MRTARPIAASPARNIPRKLHLPLLILCLLFTAGITLRAARSEVRYHFDVWKTQQGLPQNTVKTILQTANGYLWVATQAGVARFDGIHFQVFDRVNTPELRSDSFISLAEDRQDQSLWLAVERGIAHHKNGKFHYLPYQGESPTDNNIWSICPRRGGGVWLATDGGLKTIRDESMKTLRVREGSRTDELRALLEDEDGTLWVGSGIGLERRDPGTGSFNLVWTAEDHTKSSVTCLARGHSSNLWIGTSHHGLLQYQNGEVTQTVASLSSARIRSVKEDSEGVLWIILGDGQLVTFRDGVLRIIGKNEGIGDEPMLCAQEDREGNLWFGTQFSGLMRVQRGWFLAYSATDGLGHRNVRSICEGRDGCLWFGTDDGLTCLRNGSFENHRLGKSSEDNRIRTVLEDRAGNVWVGTKSAGLRIFRDGEAFPVPLIPATNRVQVSALFEDQSGTVWVGAFNGLYEFRDGVAQRVYTTLDGLATNDVRGIHGTKDGDLWIGTNGRGLSRLRAGRFTTFTTAEGLAGNNVWVIHEDPLEEGVLWIGTETGLTRMKNTQFTSFTQKEGLFDNVINDILDDRRGGLWIGCNRGIFRVSKKQLTDLADHGATNVQYVAYGESDGMLSSETNGENQPAACRTHDGNLWFPTMRGVVTIDPAKANRNELEPPVVLEEVKFGEEVYDPLKPALLPAGSGAVAEFRFTANSLTAPDKVLFRYRLEGNDKGWTKPAAQRGVTYANLRPGKYVFRVRACNNHGKWNDDGASFSFEIAPHFYQTRPFYAGAVLLVGLVVLGVHRFRVNVVRKIGRLERQHALEKERTRIAKEMHDDLGSSLTQIALTSELAGREFTDRSPASEYIRTIASTTREVFRAMDEIVWAVNPKHDTLDSLVAYIGRYAQAFLQPTGIRCRLDFPAELPAQNLTAEQRHNLFLAFKEGLNNVVKHAAASEVWIRMSLDQSRCLITIEDNGRGFDTRTARAEGNGLQNMRMRLSSVGGNFEIHTGPQQGTRLRMTVHLKNFKPSLTHG